MREKDSSPAAVRLLFDDHRVEQEVDVALQGRAAVIGLVDTARECDELLAELTALLADADRVLDVPQRLIDALQLTREGLEPRTANSPSSCSSRS